jgi:PAS domain S-box-containing protein
MITSPSQTTNGVPQHISLAAFRAFVEADRPVLAAALLRDLAVHERHDHTMSDEQRAQRVSDNIDAYMAGVDEPDHLAQATERQLGPLLAQGLGLDDALRFTSIYRQHFIDVSLRAIQAGVEGAVDGLRGLMELADVHTRVLARFYQERLRLLETLVDNSPDGVLVVSREGEVSYANQAMHTLLGYEEALVGQQIQAQLATPQEELAAIGQQISTNGSWSGILGYRRRDGGVVQCHGSSFLIKHSDDDLGVIASVVRDLTEQQRAEKERITLQEQVIAAQQAALRELSTPLIPIAEGVVAMPLIGSIDSGRAQMVVEELLRGVAINRATTAIVDITGVPVVDTQVAGALVRAAQAVELLGAHVLLTGIRPEVAQTLVGIGVNLGSIITRSTLQDGITFALSQHGR